MGLRWNAGPTAALTALLVLGTATSADAARRAAVPRLQAFSSCPALVGYARSHAARLGGATGVASPVTASRPQALTAPPLLGAPVAGGTRPARGPAAASDAGSEAAPDASQTNVQEAGVDELDIVKSDGRRIVALANDELLVLDVTGPAPVVRGRLALEGADHQLLVRGDTALVTASLSPGAEGRPAFGPAVSSAPSPAGSRPATRLSEVDLADPTRPVLRRSLTLDGTLVDARLTEGTARVVVTSTPLPLEEGALARAGLRTWVPRTVLRSRVSGRTFTRGVVGCDDVRRPRAFSGLDLLSVLTVDLDRGLFSVDRDAILAGAQTVYASPGSLYVASRSYSAEVEAGTGVPDGVRTQIHRYDTSAAGATTYRATGEVPGFVIGQYALSEYEDRLRVATTSEPAWLPDGGPAGESESRVTVLAQDAGRLRAVGTVSGLGRGERVQAVRFLGARGYVVTFRQTDPLYTLDLSDPAAPRVRGALELLGYSAYLHPLGEDRLLGVGQDATAEGRTTGAQLSLFDVSDPAAPRRLAHAPLGTGTATTAEFDPHAFLFWPPARLAVLPLEQLPDGPGADSFTGAVGVRVDRDTLVEAGRLAHPARSGYGVPPIGRALVVGARLYTFSHDGVQAANLADLVPVAFTPFT